MVTKKENSRIEKPSFSPFSNLVLVFDGQQLHHATGNTQLHLYFNVHIITSRVYFSPYQAS
jgi:hypothetical protein